MASIKETIVKENFLFPSFFRKLNNSIESQRLLWNFEKATVYGQQDNHMFFSIILYEDLLGSRDKILTHPYTDLFYPVLYFLDEEVSFRDVLRMKLNFYVNHTVQHVHQPHIDISAPNSKASLDGVVTAILNFTDCDGFTKIEDTKYPSKANSIVIFKGDKPHCGATPTNTKKRVVLNLNVR